MLYRSLVICALHHHILGDDVGSWRFPQALKLLGCSSVLYFTLICFFCRKTGGKLSPEKVIWCPCTQPARCPRPVRHQNVPCWSSKVPVQQEKLPSSHKEHWWPFLQQIVLWGPELKIEGRGKHFQHPHCCGRGSPDHFSHSFHNSEENPFVPLVQVIHHPSALPNRAFPQHSQPSAAQNTGKREMDFPRAAVPTRVAEPLPSAHTPRVPVTVGTDKPWGTRI